MISVSNRKRILVSLGHEAAVNRSLFLEVPHGTEGVI
ncbi:hypothetical protein S1OALGB6SA_1541 [Olavius algarvensis spirochete endosymbiont]|nr:hypothetical protein S1OALGB6SA_1541 [Olavius algarvensis spirochete endosymbiont]